MIYGVESRFTIARLGSAPSSLPFHLLPFFRDDVEVGHSDVISHFWASGSSSESESEGEVRREDDLDEMRRCISVYTYV